MKKIVIVRGDEFKVYDNDISWNEDIFEDLYKKAIEQKTQLEQYGVRMQEIRKNGKEDSPSEYLNNVIAFCGERGQGKSTAMQHFVNRLAREEDQTFEKEILRVIDPMAMEMAHEIVDIIISQLFERFQENRVKNEEKDMALSRAFQKVHRNMSVLKNAKSFIEKEYAYNGSIQNLTDIMESMAMRADIMHLIDLYLKHREKKMLVIPIDDLDLNLNNVYQVAEQLRKYFMIPRVIIVMAVNVDQLTLCVERELLKTLKPLENSQRWNIQREARNMSNRYMEKLIPFSRRLQLPDIRAIAEDGENAVEIIYRDSEKQILFDSEMLGIEKGLLNLIFQKTGLVYVAKANEVHPIIPTTLRELVNLITLLGDMGKVQAENLEIFEQYFCRVWLEHNLSDENGEIVIQLASTQLNDLHNDAFLLLYEMQKEKMGSYEKNLAGNFIGAILRAVDNAYRMIGEGKGKPSNGDLTNCLRLLRQGNKSDASRLVMAVMTLFSIRMLKLKAAGKWEVLYDFIGGNLFGEYRLIRGEALKNRDVTRRMQFEYFTENFLRVMCPRRIESFSVSGIKAAFEEEEELAKAVIFMGIYSDFIDADGTSRNLISNNNQIAAKALFDINQIFLSGVSWERMKEKISFEKWNMDENIFKEVYSNVYPQNLWRGLVCNMEELMCLAQYLRDSREISESAKEETYYTHFMDSIKQFLKNLQSYLHSSNKLEEIELGEDSASIITMQRSSLDANKLPKCRVNTRFYKLISNLDELREYLNYQKKKYTEYDYSKIEAELDKLYHTAEEHDKNESIESEISDQYGDLWRKIVEIDSGGE